MSFVFVFLGNISESYKANIDAH